MNNLNLQKEAMRLRKMGKTYGDIQKILNQRIPKSTLSFWSKNAQLSPRHIELIRKRAEERMNNARLISAETNRKKREKRLESIKKGIKHLALLMKNPDVGKIALTMLYFGEGSKTRKGSLTFGNSDSRIISLFLRLLRECYEIDENKFRCTLQCRADQDINKLERFWSDITKIPSALFYKARIDPRTIGKPSKKLDYKGVCRIDYFSADIYNELKIIAQDISETR
ncbi:MAG: hypothetical protein A3B13_00380 [Candidatus Liptonbacteria bacterium RIFCSPLOWO2_01_FULL_45_15]|uniref:Uncharacterized protein n=1 Tax=Candidatus Liptonbacteria bacterium RIFCSPLOWO2_01_FULL_45_15 TaxID=1798649 RepID=A0A1G2CE02_9BACT|nr:MAG: hypothetical protein A3B13_00380 [Candidatus Liptonbacteria bacterium RIFCSPLOWO2_01_FULL_45_15]